MDVIEWVVLELSPKSEGEDPDTLRDGILHSLKQPGVEVFIPAVVTKISGERVVHYLMEGYAFVRKTLPDKDYLKLEGTRWVQSVLTKPSGSRHARALATVGQSHIERFRHQIEVEVNQGISVGDQVVITSGPFKNITATVIEEIPEQDAVQVYVQLRSKQTILTLPRSGLQVGTRSPLSPLIGRLNLLKSWVASSEPVFNWTDQFDAVLQSYEVCNRLDGWISRKSSPYSWRTFFDWKPLEKHDFPNRVREIQTLSDWYRGMIPHLKFMLADQRVNGVDALNGPLPDEHGVVRELGDTRTFPKLEEKVLELAWFEDVLDRGRGIRNEMNELLKQQATRRRRTGAGKVPQNIIVDGHNLAFRCLYAPGMADLTDSQGRPTGVILGFLRSLGALRKRWTSAMYVSWDGSSQRRKSKYPDYKANRPSHAGPPTFDQIGYLRKILPALGVYQVFNPNEEADDVIATLVRKKLSSQKTVIFGTDRDFLQLVSDNVSVLIPALGARKEVMFDPEGVKEHYGVAPEVMVQLRALLGDSSDNLPGVPRVPKKVLKQLIQAYGSVDAVYRSGLAGVSKVQYDRLRSAEPQARINVDLMALKDVPFTRVDPNPNPDEVAALLRAVEITPNSILETFFERSSEHATGLTL
jgi:5'-3' exonuclease/transcription antitermination factor NusG